ncbi:MAG: leucine-rich repeat protein [Clostridia bacterium]|nr:leucine-rich repeat protein [Clostridia bacterium]
MSEFQIKNGVVKKYFGKNADVVIPEGVKSIGSGAFQYHKTIVTVELPASLTRVCKEAFADCHTLQRVTFSENCKLSHIGPNVFRYCYGLTDIHIPAEPENRESAEQLLKLLAIPNTNILYAFLKDRVKCNEVLQTELVRRCCLKKNRSALFLIGMREENAKTISVLLSYLKKLPLEELDSYIEKTEDTPEIRLLLLEYKSKIYPPEVLEKIDEIEMEKAFGLREKTLADYRKIFKIGRVGDGYQISGYKKTDPIVYIPGEINGLPVSIARLAFFNHPEITSVTIEHGVQRIGDQAFAPCRQLTDIYIPESVVHMGKFVFFSRRRHELTIHAPVGSYAHQYATQYKLKFEPIS